jgi:hypothetical protein
MVFITDTDCVLCQVLAEVEEIVAHLNYNTWILRILLSPLMVCGVYELSILLNCKSAAKIRRNIVKRVV